MLLQVLHLHDALLHVQDGTENLVPVRVSSRFFLRRCDEGLILDLDFFPSLHECLQNIIILPGHVYFEDEISLALLVGVVVQETGL